jgi:type II secretion system (T2SS) protein C
MSRAFAVWLISVVLSVLLVASVTEWLLRFSARRTPAEPVRVLPAADLDPRAQPADTAPIARLFGAGYAADTGGIRALGVMADEGGGRGIAVLAVGSQPARAYRSGQSIAPGVVLKEVRKDRVILARAGVLQELRIPVKSAPPATAAPLPK